MIENVSRVLWLILAYSMVTKNVCKQLNMQDTIENLHHSQLADVDISTKLIEFERIAKTIENMPSGGLVTPKRRLFTVKLAIRAILDGINGDFLETVSKFLNNIKLRILLRLVYI